MQILEVNGLRKVYTTRFGGASVEALRNINFSVENGKLRSGLRRTSAFPMRNPAMRRQIGSVTTGHSPDKNQRSRDFRKRNGIVSGCYAIICACWSIGKQHTPHSRRMPSGILFLWKRCRG